MSAAFETIGEPRVLRARQSYLPEWTPAFTDHDLDRQVRIGSRELGFTIRDMLPERRWAVAPSGVVMEQRDFEDHYQRWMLNVVRDDRIVSIAKYNEYFDPKLMAIPAVEDFVSMTEDYNGKAVRIGFDPNKPPAGGTPVKVESVRSQDADKLAALALISRLKEEGKIDAETASSEMSRILVPPQEQPAPPPGFSVVPAAEAVPEQVFAAPCGFEAKTAAGLGAHKRHCVSCQPTEPTDAAA